MYTSLNPHRAKASNMFCLHHEGLLALQLQPCTSFESNSTNVFFRLTVISDVSSPKASQILRSIDTEKEFSLEFNTNSQML